MSEQSSQRRFSPEEVKKLAAELAKLSLDHAAAVNDATFTGMTAKQGSAFDERRDRIRELSDLLAKVRPSDLSKQPARKAKSPDDEG
jgi:hypothetical protein